MEPKKHLLKHPLSINHNYTLLRNFTPLHYVAQYMSMYLCFPENEPFGSVVTLRHVGAGGGRGGEWGYETEQVAKRKKERKKEV
jgi:hypothetical protein